MEKRVKEGKVGSIAFYLSLITFFSLGSINLVNSLRFAIRQPDKDVWLPCLIAALIGAFLASRLIKGRLSVFIHEMKHALISNLVGNKWKGLVVGSSSGHFEYAYSEKTSRFNAFVSLAPYILPVLTVTGGAVSYVLTLQYPPLLPRMVSLFYGADLVLNLRDISPMQSDITDIRGGYKMGLAYIFAVNLFIFTIFLAWISGGQEGIKYLFLELPRQFHSVVTGG